MEFGWLSILPPIIAIALALITKEVISSLLIGILAGSLIYSHGNLIGMVETSFTVMGDKMASNIFIVIMYSYFFISLGLNFIYSINIAPSQIKRFP